MYLPDRGLSAKLLSKTGFRGYGLLESIAVGRSLKLLSLKQY